MKALASSILLLCLCLPAWAGKSVVRKDRDLDKQIRDAVSDIQIQIPELLKGIRIKVDMSEFQVRIPEINVRVPEILLPEIKIDVPVSVQIPAIILPEIRIQIPQLDIQIPVSLE